jgi:hypothetical protein
MGKLSQVTEIFKGKTVKCEVAKLGFPYKESLKKTKTKLGDKNYPELLFYKVFLFLLNYKILDTLKFPFSIPNILFKYFYFKCC